MASFWTKYRRNKQEVESLHHNCSEPIENDANLTCQGGICYSDSNLDDSIECDSLDNLSSESSSIEEETDSFFSGDEEAPPDMPDLATELKLWSTNHKSSRQSVNDLLGVLRQYHPDLPKDARTLLGTPSGVNLEKKIYDIVLFKQARHQLQQRFNVSFNSKIFKITCIECFKIDTGWCS